MTYFFILGKHPALSLAEVNARFPEANMDSPRSEVCLLSSGEIEDPSKTISELGGVTKIGEILEEGQEQELQEKILGLLSHTPEEGKFKFGISYYGKKKLPISQLGMEIKKHLKEKGISSRFVTSRERTLSSVVVTQNKLTTKGAEIVIVEQEGKFLIGLTRAVQPFKQLSYRDYGRPQRDDHSGMLPPKLAQMMINLATGGRNKEQVLVDPFCGSGTVLTEARLMGFTHLIGADVSPQAVQDSQENLEWIKNRFDISTSSVDLYQQDATTISSLVSPESVDAIVTEPYLGPQRGRMDIHNVVANLEDLYTQCLKEFQRILKSRGRIVMIFPTFKTGKQQFTMIHPDTSGYEWVNVLPKNIKTLENDLTSRHTLLYGRPQQKVWREIVILEKK